MYIRLILALVLAAAARAADTFPSVEVAPLPDQEIAFETGGLEVARYHGGPGAPKPFLFPLIGPAGKRLTTMSHPVDPHGHRHHRSVWIGHRDVNGVNFWEEDGGARIIMTRLEAYGAAGDSAWFRAAHEWRDAGGTVLLEEQRTLTLTLLDQGACYLDIASEFSAPGGATFGQTPYGLLGVRVTPTLSVAGGGRILNAGGAQNESGVHSKASRWADYTGPVAPDLHNGITYFDHPENPGSPATWIVRDEGWMCASFTGGAPYTLKPGESLRVRYRLYVHGPASETSAIDAHWKRFAGDATRP